MEEKLRQLARRFEAIEAQLMDGAVYSDMDQYRRLSREQKELAPVVAAWQRLVMRREDLAAALELAGDPDFKDSAQQEITQAKEDMARLEEELKVLLLPKDPNDGKNVILELRSGTGGEEAALFAHSLLRMYTMYAESKGWRVEVISCNETELGGVKEAVLMIEGEGAYSHLKFESGVHRVQRVPVTESSGRIQTSAATVAVLPEAEAVDVNLDARDLQIDTFRSSGAGGQHVNKTESAIRITHLPTGLVVECQDERDVYKRQLYINLYYGSFAALAEKENWSREDWEDELYTTLAHEFTHHIEGLALEGGLDRKDEAELAEFRAYYKEKYPEQ